GIPQTCTHTTTRSTPTTTRSPPTATLSTRTHTLATGTTREAATDVDRSPRSQDRAPQPAHRVGPSPPHGGGVPRSVCVLLRDISRPGDPRHRRLRRSLRGFGRPPGVPVVQLHGVPHAGRQRRLPRPRPDRHVRAGGASLPSCLPALRRTVANRGGATGAAPGSGSGGRDRHRRLGRLLRAVPGRPRARGSPNWPDQPHAQPRPPRGRGERPERLPQVHVADGHGGLAPGAEGGRPDVPAGVGAPGGRGPG